MTKVDALTNQDKPKDRYKITNWSEYNAGLKQRGSLTPADAKYSKTLIKRDVLASDCDAMRGVSQFLTGE